MQLVGVLSHGKVAKRLTDRAIDLMQDVQNLRKAIYECVHHGDAVLFISHAANSYKLKAGACEKGSPKQLKLLGTAVTYL